MPYRFTPWIDLIRELLGTLVGLLILWLAPIKDYVNLVVALILIDFCSGSYASYKEGEKFTARKMRKTVEKFLFYSLAIIASYVLQRIINDGDEVPRVVALYIGATELKSIFENIKRVTGTGVFGILWQLVKNKIDGLTPKSKTEE